MKAAMLAVAIAMSWSLVSAEDVDRDADSTAVAEADMSADDKQAAEAEKAAVIKPLAEAMRAAESALKEATKTRDKQKAAEAKAKVAAARKELNEAKQLSLTEWLEVARQKTAREKAKQEAMEAASQAAAERQKESAEARAAAAKVRPLSIAGLRLKRNLIGLPELLVRVENIGNQPVEAFTVDAECFNKFDEPVKATLGDNVFSGISQTTVAPGAKSDSEWQLSLHRGTGYAKVWISRVRFADGSEMKQTREEAGARDKCLFKVTLRE